MTHSISGLYAVTDPFLIPDNALLDAATEAIAGGARIIQYRDKRGDVDHHGRAEKLRRLTRVHDVVFIVNDNPQLAADVDADGIHIGKQDGTIETVRRIVGNRLIGVSCYNRLDLAHRAQNQGADYVAFGSFFETRTKSGTVRADVGLLTRARHEISIPIVAIGGITAHNGASLLAAGADALAVASGLFGADDVLAAARELSVLF